MEDGVEGSTWETFREDEVEAKVALEALPVFQKREAIEGVESIEELLDQGDVLLQEFRSGNPKLLQALCRRESLRALIQHATRPDSSVPHLRSHTAAELLSACDGKEAWKLQLLQVFDEDPSLMELLWSFLLVPANTDQPSWSVLAGYFCGAAMAVVHHLPTQVANYLRSREDQAFESFMRFLGTRCFSELFVQILTAAPVFPFDGLLRRLSERFSGGDADEGLALVIQTLLAQACGGAAEQLEQMSSCAQLLLEKALQLRSPWAAATLSAAVARLHQLSPHLLLPMRPPNLLKPLEKEAFLEDAVQGPGVQEAGRAMVEALCPSLPRFCSTVFAEQADVPAPPCAEEALREATVILLEVAEGELPTQETWDRLHGLDSPELEELLSELHQVDEAELRPQLLSKLRLARAELREARRTSRCEAEWILEASILLVELVRTQDSQVLEALYGASLLPLAVRRLRSVSAVARGVVCALCLELIRGPQDVSIQALCRFLDDGLAPLSDSPCDLVCFERKLLAELRDAGSFHVELQQRLEALPAWPQLLEELVAFEQLEQEPLGSFAHQHLPRMPVINVDVELTPEDLRDLDEDSDTEFELLDLGDRQLQRQARVAARCRDAGAGEWV